MIPVPETTQVDLAFGNIMHMPKYQDVPDRFKDDRDTYVQFCHRMFAGVITEEDVDNMDAREGVNILNAHNAIACIMRSYEPKHEHKIAGCAMLLHEWFQIKGAD